MQVLLMKKVLSKPGGAIDPLPPMVPKALILLHMRDPGNPKKFVALKMCPIASIAVM